jgi:phenylalanyl-tRNA synthetase beta chain
MRIPISWLKDFIDLEGLSVEDIARRLTLAGLEVTEIAYCGLPMPERGEGKAQEFRTGGISWDPEKIVVAEIRQVNPHPNADRLTLLDLYDGTQQHTVLTGAPNIFHLKSTGRLSPPLKVAYAKEGAVLYDGHADTQQLTTLKRTKIRGVDSYSMACSEKELGISQDHEGIILLDPDAPVGMPLADYMGDAVLEIDVMPNMARNANVLGVARELGALLGRKLHKPDLRFARSGASVKGLVSVDIQDAALNPRFVLGLIRDVHIGPSPYEVRRRLKLAGVRPINSIVDATNYAMIELGQPLHAFDYDVLKERAGEAPIKIITRTARSGETLRTLDGVERKLSPMNVLVCDAAGPLSIAGVMGGAESEVTESTTNVLLEGAAWNFINIRRTAREHDLPSEASFRFSRGVHPELAKDGVERGLQFMSRWSQGAAALGLVDAYALKPKASKVLFSPADVRRLLGIDLKTEEIVRLLTALDFKCRVQQKANATRGKAKRSNAGTRDADSDARIAVTAPPHRMDIGEGIVGLADILEELARLVGYDLIPSTNMADALPPQVGNPAHEWEEHLRDILAILGFDEVVSYRLTSTEREARLGVPEAHVRVANPVAADKSVLRRSLLASVLDDVERNIRNQDALAFFEIGPVFEPRADDVPAEPRRLAMVMTGKRESPAWDSDGGKQHIDFFDLKGRVEELLEGLHLDEPAYSPAGAPAYLHPGKAASVTIGSKTVGAFGELHPLVAERYEFGRGTILVAEFDVELLRSLGTQRRLTPIPEYPPILEDIAIVLDADVPASQVESVIRQGGGPALVDVRLFDLYRGEQIEASKKSLAYSLTYQAIDHTMTDAEAATIRNRIVQWLERELGAVLRA